MKIIHGHGYTNEELQSYRPTVCDNLVSSMMAVMKASLLHVYIISRIAYIYIDWHY